MFDKFIEVSGYENWQGVKNKLSVFPRIDERYNEQSITPDRLWEGFAMAQSLGAVIIREHTDRNTIDQIMTSNNTIYPIS